MSVLDADVYEKYKKAQKLPRRNEDAGNDSMADVRDDEEQSIKENEIIDLLVGAGYFRAKIQGLSSFDKVVGGMTWCIELCSVDVDVDLLFQENSTIGQKIALTEKIVAVLPQMQCPHQIEPHQIQGLDFIHIYPVIQWLIKNSLEYRKKNLEFVQAYAMNQYSKLLQPRSNDTVDYVYPLEHVKYVQELYGHRRLHRKKRDRSLDLDARLQLTLSEFEDIDVSSAKSNIISSGVGLERLGFEQVDVHKLHNENNDMISEFCVSGSKTIHESKLEEQNKNLVIRCDRLESESKQLQTEIEIIKKELDDIQLQHSETNQLIKDIKENQLSQTENAKEVKELVTLHERLRTQESEFKQHCKKELARLQELIKESEDIIECAKSGKICDPMIKDELDDIRQLKIHLAKQQRNVALLQRKLDQIPSRLELAQYQRRFLELYNQVAAKHRETKQYFTLYNSLEDTRQYMTKELTILNSVCDNYPQAMQSATARKEFMSQMQNIISGIAQLKSKVQQNLDSEKCKKEQLNVKMNALTEVQRKYVASVRQLSIECQHYEMLAKKKEKC